MGRPRTFDIDNALNVATDMFWRKGYVGASIGELTKAIGINAPSFYFAFGSKEALFRQIINAHLGRQEKVIDAAFAQNDSRSLTASLLLGFVAFLTDPAHAPGCLLLNNALPIDDDHPFRAELAGGRQAMRERLAKRFRQDQVSANGFPADWAPEAAARLVTSIVWGIAVEAHSGASRRKLEDMARAFVGMWPKDLQ